MKNAKFLYSAIYTFDNHALMDYFAGLGLKMKIERGNRVFPQSDHASDVIRVLTDELHRKKVRICLNTKVQEIVSDGTKVTGVRWDCHDTHQKNQIEAFDAVVAACGGVSYPTTGSDGSGFELCKKLGHTVTGAAAFPDRNDHSRGIYSTAAGIVFKKCNFLCKVRKKDIVF